MVAGRIANVSTSGTVVNLSGSAVFSSATSYQCVDINDSIVGASAEVTYTSGTSFTLTAPTASTYTYSYMCVGN
jgi:hypothetical protein